tara:strand:+ start:1943 stop:2155 length:213 start_codon:yes stop_codon:yes gene_type:complete
MKDYMIFLGGFILGILKHSVLVLMCCYLVNLFIISIFGEFVNKNKSALDEFLMFLVVFTTVYVSFLWGKK